MKLKVVHLCVAASVLITPFIAQADALIDDVIAKGAVQFFNTKACAKVCQKEISGTSVEISRVDVNLDRKAEHLVTLTDCGSAGCPSALFMYRNGAWVKLTEGWSLHLLQSMTKGFTDLEEGRGTNRDKLSWDGQDYAISITPPLRGPMIVVNEGHFLDPQYNNGVAKKSDWRQHLGTDYVAAHDTPVYATRAGEVVENINPADPMQARVIIEHGSGSRVVYGHVYSGLLVMTRVKQGEEIGRVRDSDPKYKFSSHLHYGENAAGKVGEGRNPPGWGWGRAPYNTSATTIQQEWWLDVEKVRGWGGDSNNPAKRSYARTKGSIPPSDLAISPDGQWMAWSDGMNIRIVDVQTGNIQKTLAIPLFQSNSDESGGFAVSSDGKRFFTGSHGLTAWDVTSGKQLYDRQFNNRIKGFHDSFSKLVFSADEHLLYGGTLGGYVYTLDANSGREVRRYEIRSGDRLAQFIFSPQANLGAVFGDDGLNLTLFDLTSGQLLPTIGDGKKPLMSALFSPDGKLLATCSQDGVIEVWDTASHTLRTRINMGSGGKDVALKYLDMASNTMRTQVVKLGGGGLAFSPDSKLIAVALYKHELSEPGMVRIFDAMRGAPIRELRHDKDIFHSVLEFSKDGRWLGLIEDGKPTLWDMRQLGISVSVPTPASPSGESPSPVKITSCDAPRVTIDKPSPTCRERWQTAIFRHSVGKIFYTANEYIDRLQDGADTGGAFVDTAATYAEWMMFAVSTMKVKDGAAKLALIMFKGNSALLMWGLESPAETLGSAVAHEAVDTIRSEIEAIVADRLSNLGAEVNPNPMEVAPKLVKLANSLLSYANTVRYSRMRNAYTLALEYLRLLYRMGGDQAAFAQSLGLAPTASVQDCVNAVNKKSFGFPTSLTDASAYNPRLVEKVVNYWVSAISDYAALKAQ